MGIEEKAKKIENVINKLKGANLGDSDRLNGMIQMLKEGSDLESTDKQYLKELYKQYKYENKKTKKITPVGYGMIIVMIAAIVAGVIVLLPEESETVQNETENTEPIRTQNNSQIKLLEEIQEAEKELQYYEELKQKDPSELDAIDQIALKGDLEKYKEQSEQRIERLNMLKQQGLEFLDTEEEILDYVFGYRGKDNQGNNLRMEMVLYMIDMYPETFSDENPFIKDHKYYVTSAVDSDTIEISMGDAIEERYRYAYFLIFTPEYGNYKTVFAFLFDTETYKIVGDNELAKSIMKILDTNN